MPPISFVDLLTGLGSGFASGDYEAERARTRHATSIRDLAAQGLARRTALSENAATTGNVHSGANLKAQTELGSTLDSYRAQADQGLQDRLADIARRKLNSEASYNISSLMPR